MIAECGMGKLESGGAPTYLCTYLGYLTGDGHDAE